MSLYVHMHTFIPQTRHPFDFHKKKGSWPCSLVPPWLHSSTSGMQANKGGIQLVGLILEVQDQTKGLVFGMVHIKDSLLPMGKVWSLDSLASYFSFISFICHVSYVQTRAYNTTVKFRSLSCCNDIFHFMNKAWERNIETDGLGSKKDLAIL